MLYGLSDGRVPEAAQRGKSAGNDFSWLTLGNIYKRSMNQIAMTLR
jgi:hypothetical protein